MTANGPRYPRGEFTRRGTEIYHRVVHPNLKSEDDGKFVAIDIETEDYSIDADDLTAIRRLKVRDANAQVFILRTGPEPAYQL